MSFQTFTLAWRQTARDFRSGELRLLIVAVMLAVAALTAVGFFADRLKGGLARDARQLLGGDAIVASDQPTPAALVERARESGLQATSSVTFPSMARATDAQGGASRLIALKAVGEGYPLRSKVRLADGAGQAEAPASGPPAPGTVWVEAGVLDALALKVGDPVLLGDATLRIGKLITFESDRGAGFMSFSPRVMLNVADLPATALIQPASRVTYRLALAAPEGRDRVVTDYVAWAEAHIKSQNLRGVRVESLGMRPAKSH